MAWGKPIGAALTRTWIPASFVALHLFAAALLPCRPAPAAEPIVLRGHSADVFMAAFTPDGGRVVTASADETARLWDAGSGRELRRFVGHTGPVSCLAVSGDGRTLVTGAQDNSVRVWSLPLPGPRFTVPTGPTGAALLFMPDGRTAITAGGGRAIRAWRPDTLVARPADQPAPPPAERTGHEAPVVLAAASLDGTTFATADESGQIVLWSPLLDEPLGTVGFHVGGLADLAFQPDGQRIVTTGRDGTLRSWTLPPVPARIAPTASAAVRDLVPIPNQSLAILAQDDAVRVVDTQSLQVVRELARSTVPVRALALTPDGAIAAVADGAGNAGGVGGVRLVQVADAADRGRVAGHDGAVEDVAFLPDGKGLVTAGADGTVRRWLLPTAPAAVAGHTAAVQSLAGAPGGEWFASGGDDRTVRLWDSTGQSLRTIGTHTAAVQALAIAPDEKVVASGDAGGTLAFWGAADAAARGAVVAHRGGVRALAFDRTGTAVWSSGNDGAVKRWRMPMAPPRTLPGHTGPIRAAAASVDGRLAVTGGQDQSVRLWDAVSGQPARSFGTQPAGPVAAVAIAADGGVVAAVTDTGTLRVWNGADGTQLLERTVPGGSAADVASLHAGTVATLGQDNVIRLWDPGVLPEASPAAEAAPIVASATSRDATRFAVASDVGGRPAIVVRDRATGQAVGTCVGPTAPIATVALSRDGSHVAAAAGPAVFVWPATGGEPAVLSGLPASVSALAVADDGRTCILATGDATIRLWSVVETKELRQFAGHAGPVRHLILDDGTVVSGGDDGAVICWDLAAGTPIRSVPLGAPVRAIDIAGGRVAAAGGTRTIHLFTATEANPPTVVPALPQDVTGLRWSADGRLLAVVSPDAIRVLQADGIHLESLPAPGAVAVFWRPDGARLLALRGDGSASALAVSALHAVALPDADIRVLAAAPSGDRLVAAGAGGRLIVHRVEHGRFVDAPPVRVSAGAARVTDVAFAADGTLLAAACEDGRIGVWDAPALATADAPPRVTFAHGAAVRGVALDGGGDGGRDRRLVVAADDAVASYDLVTGIEAERMTPPLGQSVVATTAGGTWLTGGQDGIGRIWTPALERVALVGPTPTDVCTVLATLAGDGGVVGLAPGGGVKHWLPDGTPVPPLLAESTAVRLAVAPDGKRVAAVDAAGGVRVWRGAAGGTIGPFPLGPGVTAIAFSPDGSQLLVGDAGPRLRAFDAESGRLVEEAATIAPATMVLPTGPAGRRWVTFGSQPQGAIQERSWVATSTAGGPAAASLAVTPDGTRLFAGYGDGTIQQIALANAAVERTLSASAAAIHELSLEPAAGLLAAAGDDGLRIWNLAEGTLARQAAGRAPLRRVAFGAGKRVATVDELGLVQLWQADTGAALEAFTGHPPGNAVARFASDGQTIVSAGADGRLTVRRGGALSSAAVAVTPLGSLVVAGGNQVFVADGGAVRVVDLATGTIARTLREGLAPPLVLALRPDGTRLAIGSADGLVHIVNPAGGGDIVALPAEGPISALAWRADGQRIVAGTRSGGGEPARIATFGPPLPPLQPGVEFVPQDILSTAADVVRLAWDRDGRDVWALHADGVLARWAPAVPAPLFKLDHGGPVLAVVVSRDGETIVSAGGDQSVRVWDATTGQQRSQMTGHGGAVHALAFTPDEAFVVSAGADRTLRLWDVAGGRQLKQVATTEETVYSVAVHPAGQSIAAGGADRAVHLVNLLSGATERSLVGHGDFVHGVAFNPAGTTLLSYGYAGELRIWGLASGSPLLDTRVGRIGNSAGFDARGERIVVANGDRTATVIEVPAGAR